MFTASLAQIPARVPVVYQYMAENSPEQAHRFSLVSLFKRLQCLVLFFFFFQGGKWGTVQTRAEEAGSIERQAGSLVV